VVAVGVHLTQIVLVLAMEHTVALEMVTVKGPDRDPAEVLVTSATTQLSRASLELEDTGPTTVPNRAYRDPAQEVLVTWTTTQLSRASLELEDTGPTTVPNREKRTGF
jgi:hypothetical protein